MLLYLALTVCQTVTKLCNPIYLLPDYMLQNTVLNLVQLLGKTTRMQRYAVVSVQCVYLVQPCRWGEQKV